MSLHDEVSNLTPFVFDDPESGPGEEFVQRDKVIAILARHPEPAVSDGERETLACLLIEEPQYAGPVQWGQAFYLADRLIAAGYRKPTLPSVEEVAESLRFAHPGFPRTVYDDFATAVLALLKRGA